MKARRAAPKAPAIQRAIPRTGEDLARAARATRAASVPAPFHQPSELAAAPKQTGAYVGWTGQSDGVEAAPNESECAKAERQIAELMRRPGVRAIRVERWW